jgi:hypothetical protein
MFKKLFQKCLVPLAMIFMSFEIIHFLLPKCHKFDASLGIGDIHRFQLLVPFAIDYLCEFNNAIIERILVPLFRAFVSFAFVAFSIQAILIFVCFTMIAVLSTEIFVNNSKLI